MCGSGWSGGWRRGRRRGARGALLFCLRGRLCLGSASVVSTITPADGSSCLYLSHKHQPYTQIEMGREGEQACLVQALQQRAATLEAESRGLKVNIRSFQIGLKALLACLLACCYSHKPTAIFLFNPTGGARPHAGAAGGGAAGGARGDQGPRGKFPIFCIRIWLVCMPKERMHAFPRPLCNRMTWIIIVTPSRYENE